MLGRRYGERRESVRDSHGCNNSVDNPVTDRTSLGDASFGGRIAQPPSEMLFDGKPGDGKM